jgi:hypothetical protein
MFGLIPRTGVNENDFFYNFYIFHNAKVARPDYKKVQLVEDFEKVRLVVSKRNNLIFHEAASYLGHPHSD